MELKDLKKLLWKNEPDIYLDRKCAFVNEDYKNLGIYAIYYYDSGSAEVELYENDKLIETSDELFNYTFNYLEEKYNEAKNEKGGFSWDDKQHFINLLR